METQRDLGQAEIDLINECQHLARMCDALIEKLKDNPEMDKRWVAIGATDIQK